MATSSASPNCKPKALYILETASKEVIYGPEEQQKLAELADFYAPPQTRESIRENLALLADAEVIFSGWGAPVMDEEFMAAAKSLKTVFYGAGSIRSFTPPAFWDRNIPITSAADANAVPVAEYCVATIVLSLKDFWSLTAATRRNEGWVGGSQLRKMAGCFRSKVGFISLGIIARKTLKLMDAYDINRLVYSTSLSDEDAKKMNVTKRTVDEIFAESDVISLHTPSLPSTKGMICGRHFEMMKPGATFINTARGAVVNEEEMIEVLRRRPDITVVLDVTEPEPPVFDSPLTKLPNVVLSPHIAGSVGPECKRLGYNMLLEFQRYLAGEPLKFQISREAAAKMA
jgi:phosphoglycerate dehydrogenase-like enzyme